jgi:hypothetical protein
MVAYGYLAYLIRVAPPHRTRNLQRLSEFGEHGLDLQSELTRRLDEMGTAFVENEGLAEGYRVASFEERGRSIFIKMRRGPVGHPGEMLDLDDQTSVEAGRRKALLSELRAGFYLPRNSYYGFLFVERNGGRHVKDLIYQQVVKPVAERTFMGIRVEGFALTDDWRRELDGKQVLRITEVLEPTDSAHDPSTVDDVMVRVTAEGPGLSSRGSDLKGLVLDLMNRRHAEYRALAKVADLEERRMVWTEKRKRDGSVVRVRKKAPRSGFTVADEREYKELLEGVAALRSGPSNEDLKDELRSALPVDRDQFESRRVEVSFGEKRPEKTFVVAGDRVPQLVYEFGGWMLDSEIRSTWDSTSESFLTGLGVSLPSGWPVEPTL